MTSPAFSTPPCPPANRLRTNWYEALEAGNAELAEEMKRGLKFHLKTCKLCITRAQERNQIAERIAKNV